MTPGRPTPQLSAADMVGLAFILPPQDDPDDPIARTQAVLRESLRSSVPGCPHSRARMAADDETTVGRGGVRSP